ncbi:MAG: hypothetical protein H7239_06380 [Flavobacterium sp.]|nr:hypothetical protein [Flavobacterium sp.]
MKAKQMKTILTIALLTISILSFSQKKHPKVISENPTKKNFLDRRTHPNSEIVDFKFADGISCQMVKKGDNWFNYNIRGEKKEKQFDSKEAGLQKIWVDAVNIEAIGGAIAGAAVKSKHKKEGPEGKVGVDKFGKKYKVTNGQKVYTRDSFLPNRTTN